jgi:sRNA-binding protein
MNNPPRDHRPRWVHEVGAALRTHSSRGEYQAAILEAGAARYDLNGNRAGEVTQEQVDRLQASRTRAAQRKHQRFLEQGQHNGRAV